MSATEDLRMICQNRNFEPKDLFLDENAAAKRWVIFKLQSFGHESGAIIDALREVAG